MKITHSALIGSILITICHGQITIVDSGATGNQVNLVGTYVQNFDTLLASTPSGGAPWVNNTTIPGWYSSAISYYANTTSGALGSYGVGNNPERALGSGALRFVNSSSQTITGFNISYTGEQWYRGANDPQGTSTMFFDYLKYTASTTEAYEIYNIGGVGRVDVPELRFIAPNRTDTTASILDGNASENRAYVNFTLTGIAIAPGEKLWLRWSAGSLLSQPHVIAIDDVQVSFLSTIPEPASFATFAAAGGLAFAIIRRRRQKQR